jgi:hypothetical protein
MCHSQIFRNENKKKSKFYSGGNEEETEFWQSLLLFMPELFVFLSAVEKLKN